jgi:hypothetical protein
MLSSYESSASHTTQVEQTLIVGTNQQHFPPGGRAQSCFPREERDQRDQDSGSPTWKNPRDLLTGKTLPFLPFLPFI